MKSNIFSITLIEGDPKHVRPNYLSLMVFKLSVMLFFEKYI